MLIKQKYTHGFLLFVAVLFTTSQLLGDQAHSIFVPRQLSYNPIYEDALVYDKYAHMDECFLFSVKPIYTQNVGSRLKKYFNINHASCMSVQENGTGMIDSLWFKDISSVGTMYSSILSFNPIQQSYGAMLYGVWNIGHDFSISVNTAAIGRTNNIHICESAVDNLGTVTTAQNIAQALSSPAYYYGRVCGGKTKAGLDDIQVKLIKNFTLCDDSLFADVYALLGIPTGKGSKARYLFEPLVGSNHVQFGLGLNAEKQFSIFSCDGFSVLGELKWRYGFKATEVRSFDLAPNGQWSRYLLFTTPANPITTFPAINELTFRTSVTPQNSFDLLLAGHYDHKQWGFELGYNLWYRQAEKVSLHCCSSVSQYGIADLVGIANMLTTPGAPTSASTANISQSVLPGPNQIVRDAAYTTEVPANINLCSGAQPTSFSNAIYGSIGYTNIPCWCPFDVGLNVAYEKGSNGNTPDMVSVWANFDYSF